MADIYHQLTELQEGNVLICVCQSVSLSIEGEGECALDLT